MGENGEPGEAEPYDSRDLLIRQGEVRRVDHPYSGVSA